MKTIGLQQAVREFGVPNPTIRSWITSGKVRAEKDAAGHWAINLTDVAAAAAARRNCRAIAGADAGATAPQFASATTPAAAEIEKKMEALEVELAQERKESRDLKQHVILLSTKLAELTTQVVGLLKTAGAVATQRTIAQEAGAPPQRAAAYAAAEQLIRKDIEIPDDVMPTAAVAACINRNRRQIAKWVEQNRLTGYYPNGPRKLYVSLAEARRVGSTIEERAKRISSDLVEQPS